MLFLPLGGGGGGSALASGEMDSVSKACCGKRGKGIAPRALGLEVNHNKSHKRPPDLTLDWRNSRSGARAGATLFNLAGFSPDTRRAERWLQVEAHASCF